MKKATYTPLRKIKSFGIILTFLIVPLISFSQDDPSLPPPPANPTPGASPKVGSGAPIGEGLPWMFTLALLYAAFKFRQSATKNGDEERVQA